MKILNEKKSNLIDIFKIVLDYAVKTSVLLLFMFLFFGRLSPSWISEKMKPNKSIIKSAFLFKSYVSEILESDSSVQNDDELENPFGDMDSTEDIDSYDDFYAAFAAMVEEAAAEESTDEFAEDFEEWDESFEDDSELQFEKAEKIKVVKFSDKWNDFKNSHEEIASALEFSRLASIITFFSVMIVLAGLFLCFSDNKIKRLGLIIICAGSIITSFSLYNFTRAYNMLSSSMDLLDVAPVQPHGIFIFLLFAILSFVFAAVLLFFEKTDKEKASELNPFPFRITFRILSLLLFILLFIPGANPARISENINRNVSLFTSGISYSTYTANLQRALIRGWLPEYVTRIAWISSLFVCIGIIACGIGSCMSIGNNKFKRYAHITLFGGTVVSFISLFGILYAHTLLCSSPNVEKLLPLESGTIVMYFVLLAVILLCTVVSFLKTPAPEKDEKCQMDPPLQLFVMLLPFLILVFLFSYLPLWGWRYAFFDYQPGDILSMDAWVGFKWFKAPFENAATRSDILRVLRNTLAMSGLGILGSWLPMVFAIFLSEIKNVPARKIIQTLTTIPNFISWVLVYAIAFCIFGTEGFISSLMINSGIWDKGVNMLMSSKGIWLKMWLWGLWKSLGWSAIMYIAAIAGIDQQLYEAATVDGAGRFQKMWHITIPELFPTYIVLLILSISGILSNGMDQYLCFKNSRNKGPIEVLDLYVYQLSFGSTTNSNIPFSTVVSMFKSLVSVVLLFFTNKISKIIRGNSIF